MGTPLVPPPPGVLCPLCWGSSTSPFGLGPTPSVITLVISGVEKGSSWTPAHGEPGNGSYTLEQTAACTYGVSAFGEAQWVFGAGFTASQYFTPEGFGSYGNIISASCLASLDNILLNPFGAFFGGTGEISL